MKGRKKEIDARGLACPGPVVEIRKALEEGGFDLYEILVDNAAARDNVSRYAAYTGCSVETREEGQGAFRLSVKPPNPGQAASPGSPLPVQEGEAGATILFARDMLGQGPEELGSRLMKAFIYALAESARPPRRMIFMNSGVRLAIEGSASLEDLRRLEKSGVEILACGTCLDYYNLKDCLGVGRVSNMYEIAECLLEGRSLSI